MRILIAVLILSLFIACQPVNRQGKQKTGNKLKQLEWLAGKWQMQRPEGIITEEWLQPSDTQWQGKSLMITPNGDTPFIEHIRLNYRGDRLYYAPSVANQNGGREVNFAEKSFTDSLVIFENQNHDFPQRIIYKRISDTSILAAVEGVQNGKNYKEEFTYTRK